MDQMQNENDNLPQLQDHSLESALVPKGGICLRYIPQSLDVGNVDSVTKHLRLCSISESGEVSEPLASSKGRDHKAAKYDSGQGERDRVRQVEDLENWAHSEPVQLSGDLSTETFTHLPDWSTLGAPFKPVDDMDLPVRVDKVSRSKTSARKTCSRSSRSRSQSSPPNIQKEKLVPHASPTSQDTILTAYPHGGVVQQDVEERFRSLLDPTQFENFLSHPANRAIFRDWLLIDKSIHSEGDHTSNHLPLSVTKLDEWAARLGHGDNDVLMNSKTDPEKSLTEQGLSDPAPATPDPPRGWLLQSLYDEDFKRFITSKLVDIVKKKLGGKLSEEEYGGLGHCFCLTNPRFKDNPIVIVSTGFVAMTGYSSASIIGRNCRFLQGPGTNPQSIQRMRASLMAGEPCVELLLNYRSDGTPFNCLLTMFPLFDQDGALTYFVGGQVNVTAQIEVAGNLTTFLQSPSNSSLKMADPIKPNAALLQSPGALNRRPSTDSRSSSEISVDRKRTKLDWILSRFKREEIIELNFNGIRVFDPLVTLESNALKFQASYSRLILFKKKSRSIVFVTPETLDFLGLPTRTLYDTWDSPLLHTDFLALVESGEANHKTKALRASLRTAIQSDRAASVQCNLTWKYIPYMNGNAVLNKPKAIIMTRPCFLHISPLIDRSATCTSFVAVLG